MLELNKIYCGDCLEVMKKMDANSIDTIITDPPYGLEFMGKDWDKFKIEQHSYKDTQGILKIPSGHGKVWTQKERNVFQEWTEQWANEALRVAKPGATLLCFGGTRTYHRLTCAIEDAGWIIKDCIMWIYGSGFPKATDISKQLDKGHTRVIIGKLDNHISEKTNITVSGYAGGYGNDKNLTAPHTKEAKLWDGWKSHGLKPAYEPIVVAMKSNEGNYANNALKYGVGGLNIDGGRISFDGKNPSGSAKRIYKNNQYDKNAGCGNNKITPDKGRYPANIILDEEVTKADWSRYFYCAKASKSERNIGCEKLEEKVGGGMEGTKDQTLLTGSGNIRNNKTKNNHPTVKPLKLMEYLCRLTKTPTGGIVLDPFAGSGTTGMACKKTGRDYILIEKDPEYVKIAEARLKNVTRMML